MKKLILSACIVAIATVSCKKDNASSSSTTICTTAMVYNGGDPNTDGLGWILLTDTVSFKYEVPDNLDNMFKIDSLLVDV